MQSQPKAVLGSRIRQARIGVGMTPADLAVEVRKRTAFKTTERQVRSWEKGSHAPRHGILPAIAIATGQTLEFFYEAGPGEDDDEEVAALQRSADLLEALGGALMQTAAQQRAAVSVTRPIVGRAPARSLASRISDRQT